MAKRDKFIEEYSKDFDLYKEYVETLQNVLKKLLDKYKIQAQAVQGRTKDIESLKLNLKVDKYKNKTIQSTREIIDLAACRVIFYLDRDINKFKNVLFIEFQNQETKNKWSKNNYNAYHFIGTFSKERTKLSEYEKFKDLTFEIQLTTVLYHGWNELDHDLFYKDKAKLKKVLPAKFKELKEIAEGIMEKQLKKAQNSWSYIYEQYELAAEGKTIFDIKNLQQLSLSDNNNEIHKNLERFNQITEEVRDIPEEQDLKTLLELLKSILKKARENKYKEEKTLFGKFKGKKYSDIATLIIELLGYLKYKNLDLIFSFITEIYPKQPKEVQNKIEELISKTAAYNLNILKKQGYIAQYFFLNKIQEWTIDQRIELLPIICSIAKPIFSPDFRNITSEYKEGNDGGIVGHFQNLSLKDDKHVRKLRDDLIELLISLYSQVTNFSDKEKILKDLEGATHFSHYTNDTKVIVVENTKKILNFYIDIITQEPPEILSMLEEQVGGTERQFENENLPGLKTFWEALEQKDEFQIYKILVGYDRRFDKNFSWREAENFRKQKIEEFIDQIDVKNWHKWKKQILKIAATYRNTPDFGKFHGFCTFLINLSEKKPKFTLSLIDKMSQTLQPFLYCIIAGLWKSNKKEHIKKIIKKWLSKEEKLLSIAQALKITDKPDSELFKSLFEVAKRLKGKKLKTQIIHLLLIIQNFGASADKGLFLELIEELSKLNAQGWINNFYGEREGKKTIFDRLNKKEWDRTLEVLTKIDQIDYNAEYILEILAEKQPKKLVDFFEKRTEHEYGKSKKDWSYSAIPHDLFRLNKVLEEKQDEIADEIFKWFEKKKHSWKAGVLLHSLYPNFCNAIKQKINNIIDSGDVRQIEEKVMPVFQWYQGDILEEFVVRIVKNVPKDEKLWGTLIAYIANPGMVSGNVNEPIFANAYRAKLKKVESWESSDNENFQEFTEEYKKYLENSIKTHEKEHEGKIEKIRRQYGNE
jgi:ppGpp synthetase/RelA/SpoT-type nucleotidyltranferase